MLLVVIPGFGPPHLPEKINILRLNLETLQLQTNGAVAVHIFCYGDMNDIPQDLCGALTTVTWHFEKGIIGYFLYKYVTPEFVNNINPSEVMILLDDVELDASLSLPEARDFINRFQLDLVSPSLSKRDMTYWEFMTPQPKVVFARIMPVIELFCYLFTKDAYISKYYKHIDPNNPWMWGMDFIIQSHFGIRGALLNNTLMHHHFSGACYTKELNDPRTDSDKYLKKYNTSWAEIHAKGVVVPLKDIIYCHPMHSAAAHAVCSGELSGQPN